MKNKLVKVKIERQGAPLVHTDNAYIQEKGKNIVAICVDLKSKYCEVECLGTSKNNKFDAVFIGASSESIKLKKGVHKDECTKIYFPEYEGWKVFCSTLTRYTLRVCLVKK